MNTTEILRRMTLEEKIHLLSGKNFFDTLDYPQYGITSMVMADGPCGLRRQEGENDHLGIHPSIPATATVSGGCLAATWNRECAYKNGKILGEEAAREGVDVLLAPAMNIVRSPLCGRNFEYFSEDPCLTGEIAAAYTDGVQSTGTGACLKHYAANNQETEREFINTIVDERTLREIYLSGFETAVKKAKPQAVMAALNQINGVYGAEHKQLLTDILREEWGFDGITVSDWFGVVHASEAVKAGMDLEMPYSEEVGAQRIKDALQKGDLTEEEIDVCCAHIINAARKCAERKKTGYDRKKESREKMWERHHREAVEIAQEGIILLRNENKILPLKPEEKVCVIGYYAEHPRFTLDGSAKVICTGYDVPLEEIRNFNKDVKFAQGYCKTEGKEELQEEAVTLAKESDKVIFFMGQPDGVEKEGHDRKNINLPVYQEELLGKLIQTNPNIIVVLSNASAVAMPWRDEVKGIFECFFAGQGMGKAISNLLYGKVNPSGKLPVSFTKRLEDTSAWISFPGNKKKVVYGEGVFNGYRYYDVKHTELLYPFGFGMSYTCFQYSGMEIPSEVFEKNEEQLEVSLKVKNIGEADGAEVVQLYIGMPQTGIKRPVKELKGFEKIFLKQGEEKTVHFILTKRDFAFYDENYAEWQVDEGEYQLMAGSSAEDIRLVCEVHVEPKKKRKKVLSGWSEVRALRETREGEVLFQKWKEKLKNSIKDENGFLKKEYLEEDEFANNMRLRRFCVYSHQAIDNDELQEGIEEANNSRKDKFD